MMVFQTALAAKLGDEFKNVKVANGVFDAKKRRLSVTIVTVRVLTTEEKRTVEETFADFLPSAVKSVEYSYRKSYIDCEIAVGEVMSFTKRNFPAMAGKLTEKNLDVSVNGETVIGITLDEKAYALCEKQGYFAKLLNYFTSLYIGEFAVCPKRLGGGVDVEALKSGMMEKNRDLAERYASSGDERVIKVDKREAFIGKKITGDPAYIVETFRAADDVILCGRVKNPEVKESKAGRKYFRFDLEDFTGSIKCMYFPRSGEVENSVPEYVREDREVLVRGSVKADRNGDSVTMMMRSLSSCRLPEKFVYKRQSKPVKEEYTVVFPRAEELTEQAGLFEGAGLAPPNSLRGKRVVVFDLETTGLDPACYAITEIGAVAIESGVIKESFLTFVNPEMPISLEITKITGIEDYMVKDAPKITDVIGDFHKFCFGSTMVAHNLDFDIKFIERFASENGYVFNCETADTLALSRKLVKGLRNYKLDTVAAALGVSLDGHHRALNDAMCTAKIYIELMRIEENSATDA